jgi:xylose isomerase
MRDEAGVVQLWLISPQGRDLRQLTHNVNDIQSAFNWHPSGSGWDLCWITAWLSVMPGAVKLHF